MRTPAIAIVSALLVAAGASGASAQLDAASEGRVVYGHHHLNVTDVAQHRHFWVDALGGAPTPIGAGEMFKFTNVLVFVTPRAPEGGTKGTTVNHIGFWVPDVRAALATVRDAGYPIVTREELPPSLEVVDDMAYIADQDTYIAYVMGPDEVKVELVENRGQASPMAMHHVHFDANDVDAMKAWYVEMLGAAPGMRGSFQAADLPGVNLTWSPSSADLVGTQGRSLDHIGFEVDNLEAFCEELAAKGVTFDRPYEVIEALGLGIAFFTDPWGTYVELTEGLDEFYELAPQKATQWSSAAQAPGAVGAGAEHGACDGFGGASAPSRARWECAQVRSPHGRFCGADS